MRFWPEAGRVFCAFLFIVLLIIPLGWMGSVAVMLVALVVVRVLDGRFRALRQTVAVLKWLVIPIVGIHAFATPGTVVWGNESVHVTREGLQRGALLGLHLAQFFLSGLCIGRMWSMRRWMEFMACLPRGLGSRAYAYAVLVFPLRASVMRAVDSIREARVGRSGWKSLPLVLEAGVRRAMLLGRLHGEQLWLRWGEQPGSRIARRERDAMWSWWIVGGILMLIGWQG